MSKKKRFFSALLLTGAMSTSLLQASFAAKPSSDQSWQHFYNEADGAIAEQKFGEAEQLLRRALTVVPNDKSHEEARSRLLLKLANTLTLNDQTGEAQSCYQKLLSLEEHHHGADSSHIVPALLALGSIQESEGNHTTAMQYYKRALQINERNYGPYSPAVADNLQRMGRASWKAGNRTESSSHYKRSIGILLNQPGLGASDDLLSVMSDYSDMMKGHDNSNKDLLADFKQEILTNKTLSTGEPAGTVSSKRKKGSFAASDIIAGNKNSSNSTSGVTTGTQSSSASTGLNTSAQSTTSGANTTTQSSNSSTGFNTIAQSSNSSTGFNTIAQSSNSSTGFNTTAQSSNSSTGFNTTAQSSSASTGLNTNTQSASGLNLPRIQPDNSVSPAVPSGVTSFKQQDQVRLNAIKDAQTNMDPEVGLRGIKTPIASATLSPAYRVLNSSLSRQSRYGQSAENLERAIAADVDALGANHPTVANDLTALAQVKIADGKYAEGRELLYKALPIYEKAYGTNNALTINAIASLAFAESQCGNYDIAFSLYKKALASGQTVLGPNSLETARILNEMAHLYYAQGKLQESRTFYEWAVASTQAAVGDHDSLLAACLKDYAQVLRSMGKDSEATAAESRAQKIIASAQ